MEKQISPDSSTFKQSETFVSDDCGLVYIATKDVYVKAAILSAKSAREYMGDRIKIHIWADLPDLCKDAGVFDSIGQIVNPHRRSKVDYLPETPFERTLYLDADTRVISDITEMFELLDRFDIAMSHAHRRSGPKSQRQWRREFSAAFPQLNGGIILYRKTEKVIKFLESWKTAFHEANLGKDQLTLRELLWESDLQIYVLPPEYNIRYEKYLDFWTEEEAMPKILHMRKFIDELKNEV